jgi:hypothetical protein
MTTTELQLAMRKVLYAVFKGDRLITAPREYMTLAKLDAIVYGYNTHPDYEVKIYEQAR